MQFEPMDREDILNELSEIKNQYYNPNNYMQPWFSAYKTLGAEIESILEYREAPFKPQVQVVYPLSISQKNIKTSFVEKININLNPAIK